MDHLLTLAEAAERLRFSQDATRDAIREDGLPAAMIRHRYRIATADLDAWVRGHLVSPNVAEIQA
jgi:excisionase family DNA binding protein